MNVLQVDGSQRGVRGRRGGGGSAAVARPNEPLGLGSGLRSGLGSGLGSGVRLGLGLGLGLARPRAVARWRRSVDTQTPTPGARGVATSRSTKASAPCSVSACSTKSPSPPINATLPLLAQLGEG